jgi:hypothetical protein
LILGALIEQLRRYSNRWKEHQYSSTTMEAMKKVQFI